MTVQELLIRHPELLGWFLPTIAIVCGALFNITCILLKKSVDRLTTAVDKIELQTTNHEIRLSVIEATCDLHKSK